MDGRRVAGRILVVLGVLGILGIALTALMEFAGSPSVAFGLVVIVVFPFAAAIPLALLLVGRRLLRPTPIRPEEIGSPNRPPVPPVSADDVASLRGPVRACPDCGFLGIRMPTIGDGLAPGGGELGDRMVCPRCDWQGLPVQFEDPQDYRRWLADIQPPAGA